jgi:mono/diheme cytochrome c family protein
MAISRLIMRQQSRFAPSPLPLALRPFLFSFCLLLFSSCAPKPPAHITDPGQLIYLGYTNKEANCSRCHGEEGQGGMTGPKIRGVLQKKGPDHVRETIRNGKGEGDDRMPGLGEQLNGEQIEQVVRFLATWSDSGNTTSP